MRSSQVEGGSTEAVSLIILAKSGEGRQKEERKEGAVGRRREMGCRSEMDLRFGRGRRRATRSVRSLNVGNLYDWESEATLQYHYQIHTDLLWQLKNRRRNSLISKEGRLFSMRAFMSRWVSHEIRV